MFRGLSYIYKIKYRVKDRMTCFNNQVAGNPRILEQRYYDINKRS